MTPETFQSFINAISDSFVTSDFALWRDRVRLPISFVTAKGVVNIETEQELKESYDTHCAQFRDAGVTEIRRSVRSVEMLDANQVIATYDTDFLRGEELVYVPYTSSMFVSWEEADGWRCSSIMNALGNAAISAPPGLQAMRRTPEEALRIYQEHLDTVNAILQAPDMPGLCDHVAFPATFGTLDVTTEVHTPVQICALMERFVSNIRKIGMTDYIRIAKSAKFTGATRIEGWHVTHILRSGSHIVAPYKCEGAIDFTDGRWRVSRGLSQTFSHVNGLIAPEVFPDAIPNTK